VAELAAEALPGNTADRALDDDLTISQTLLPALARLTPL